MSKLASEPLLPVQQQPGSGAAPSPRPRLNRLSSRPEQQPVEASGKQKRGVHSFLSGSANEEGGDGAERKRQKAEAATKQLLVTIKGQQHTLTVFEGTHAAEDTRWVVILKRKDNGQVSTHGGGGITTWT